MARALSPHADAQLSLSKPGYAELPAQPRCVLATVASTNPASTQNTSIAAACTPGPVSLACYSNFGATLNALAEPGGSYRQAATPA